MSVSKQMHLVIPAGTKVLTRATGRVGVVIHAPAAPEPGYRVRLADGEECDGHRQKLMRTGEIEANLCTLNEEFRLPSIQELIDRKVNAAEKSTLDAPELQLHQAEADKSTLPREANCRRELNALLVRTRLWKLNGLPF